MSLNLNVHGVNVQLELGMARRVAAPHSFQVGEERGELGVAFLGVVEGPAVVCLPT